MAKLGGEQVKRARARRWPTIFHRSRNVRTEFSVRVNFPSVIWPYEGKLSERGGDPNDPEASIPLAKHFLPVDKCQHRPPYDKGGYGCRLGIKGK